MTTIKTAMMCLGLLASTQLTIATACEPQGNSPVQMLPGGASLVQAAYHPGRRPGRPIWDRPATPS